MNLDEFVSKYTNQPVDVDGVYGAQCMDLMHRYCMDVYGLPKSYLAAVDANHVWVNFSSIEGHEQFQQIANTPTGVPEPGDIIIWGTAIGQWGHVAIFVKGDANQFTSFDQNWPTGSSAHLQSHNYNGVLGWLRLKDTLEVEKKVFEELVSKATKYDEFNANGYPDFNSVKAAIEQLNGDIQAKQTTIESLNQLIKEKNAATSNLQTQISSLNTKLLEKDTRISSLLDQANKVPGLLEQIDELTTQREQWREAERTYNRTIAQLRSDNAALRAGAIKRLLEVIWENIKNWFHK